MFVTLKEAIDIANDLPHLIVKGLDSDSAKVIDNIFISFGATTVIEKDTESTTKNDISEIITELKLQKENQIQNNTINSNNSEYQTSQIRQNNVTEVKMPKKPHFEWRLVAFYSVLGIIASLVFNLPIIAIVFILLSLFVAGLACSLENGKYKLAKRIIICISM